MTTCRGYTLVEVIVAILLSAMLVSAMLTVSLSGNQNSAKIEHKVQATQAAARLNKMLKAYVLAAATNANMTALDGPNSTNSGIATWYIDTGAQSDQTGSMSTGPSGTPQAGPALYALSAGVHCLVCDSSLIPPADAACILPASLRQAPYNAWLCYEVTDRIPGPGTDVLKETRILVNWTEP